MENILATAWCEGFPSWSRLTGEIAYVCDRRGIGEIWVYDPRSSWNRPLVKSEDFGDPDTLTLLAPAFSPDGHWITYDRFLRRGRPIGIWISPTGGGTPVPLTPGTQEHTQLSPA